MLDTHDPTSTRLFLCGAIALVLHLFIGVLLNTPLFKEEEIQHSIPVQIVMPSIAASKSAPAQKHAQSSQNSQPTTQEYAEPAPTSPEKLITTNAPRQPQQVAKQGAPLTPDLPTKSPTKSQPKPPSIPQISPPTLPDFRSQLNSSKASSSAANSAMSEFAKVFKQQALVAENVQISSDDKQPLDDYELALLKKVVESQFGDKLYPFRSMEVRRKLVIEIRLMSSGQVRKATIIEPSGDIQLDSAALKGALNASPYPEPPAKDAAKGYKYQIPIVYEPESRL